MYNPNTVKTIKATVKLVNQFTPQKGMKVGIHLVMQTGEDQLEVHLGPAWFIENQELKIHSGDDLIITGSMVTFQEKEVLIAHS